MDGLRMTRYYRSLTYFLRVAFRKLSKYTFDPLEGLGVMTGLIKTRQKTLMWTKRHSWDPAVSLPQVLPVNEPSTQPLAASPSIQLTDFSTTAWHPEEFDAQETPAMAHSLFPPAISTRRPRNESDASLNDLPLPIYAQVRTSEESAVAPLIQRPSDVHRSRATPRTSGEYRRSSDSVDVTLSGEHNLSPTSPPHDSTFGGWVGLEASVHNRSGYRRANSEPGSPPGIDLRTQGLGIEMGNSNGGRAT
jgi:hypothetical protein